MDGAKLLTMTPHRLLPPLLLTLLLAARPGGALARCPGCGQGVSAGCPGGCAEEDGGPAAEGCAEAGGCLRREGQQCGVYTPNCAPGLQCQPPEKEDLPLRALLQGRGRCVRARTPSGESAAPRPCPAHVSPAILQTGSRGMSSGQMDASFSLSLADSKQCLLPSLSFLCPNTLTFPSHPELRGWGGIFCGVKGQVRGAPTGLE